MVHIIYKIIVNSPSLFGGLISALPGGLFFVPHFPLVPLSYGALEESGEHSKKNFRHEFVLLHFQIAYADVQSARSCCCRLIVQMKTMAQSTSNDQLSSSVPRRRDVYLTLINLGCVYFLISVSYSGLETLQSTVNAQQGLGTTSIGVLYAALIASSLLVSPTVVDRLRTKRTLYVFWSANAVFAVANAFPRWETLVPASAFVGVTMAFGNIVYGLYVTGLADQLNPVIGQLSPSC